MVLKAALIALLVAVATGWIAYDQADPAVCLVALTVAFSAWLTFATLLVVSLPEENAEPSDAVAPWTDHPSTWNGSGLPRLVDRGPSGNGFRHCYSPEEEGSVRC